MVRAALASLKRLLGRDVPAPEAYYFHDWQADPYVRGAYSYVPVGGEGARDALARPESDTLYFTGEAADVHGHGSTVHGAIAAGRRDGGAHPQVVRTLTTVPRVFRRRIGRTPGAPRSCFPAARMPCPLASLQLCALQLKSLRYPMSSGEKSAVHLVRRDHILGAARMPCPLAALRLSASVMKRFGGR